VDVDGYKGADHGFRALNWACFYGHTECAQLLIDHGADVNAKSIRGSSALSVAAQKGHLSCVKLLVQNGADVHCQSDDGWTPLMSSAFDGHLLTSQYLLDQKADVHYRVLKEGYWKHADALYGAMYKYATDRTPGIAFAFLSCNTDAKNVKIYREITTALCESCIETYTHVQAFIDEHHEILKHVLSEDVQVDTRVGRGDNGLYHEPLEQVLVYLGLSMKKNQTVNASIDGKSGVKRALIPGHLLNANLWFELYHRTHCSSCSTRLPKLSKKKCPCNTACYCNTDCQRKHWKTHRPFHKAAMLKKK
jgi:hypothetical protein